MRVSGVAATGLGRDGSRTYASSARCETVGRGSEIPRWREGRSGLAVRVRVPTRLKTRQ
jgi:hypothetical protein